MLKQTKHVVISSLLSGLWMLLGTILNSNGLESYGTATFLTTPFLAGMMSTLVVNWKEIQPKKNSNLAGFLTLLICYFFLIIFAFEGLFCLFMTLPLGIAMQFMGATIMWYIMKYIKQRKTMVLALVFIQPIYSIIEPYIPENDKYIKPEFELVINAPAEKIWAILISKNIYPIPDNIFLKIGVVYPLSTEMIQTENEQYLACKYSQGEVKLWIDSLETNKLLRFTISETPAPMKELSFYNEVHAPHLHGNFTVHYGQISLEKIDETLTLVKAETLYEHHIKPAKYWQIWSDYLINKVHALVLIKLKNTVEK